MSGIRKKLPGVYFALLLGDMIKSLIDEKRQKIFLLFIILFLVKIKLLMKKKGGKEA